MNLILIHALAENCSSFCTIGRDSVPSWLQSLHVIIIPPYFSHYHVISIVVAEGSYPLSIIFGCWRVAPFPDRRCICAGGVGGRAKTDVSYRARDAVDNESLNYCALRFLANDSVLCFLRVDYDYPKLTQLILPMIPRPPNLRVESWFPTRVLAVACLHSLA